MRKWIISLPVALAVFLTVGNLLFSCGKKEDDSKGKDDKGAGQTTGDDDDDDDMTTCTLIDDTEVTGSEDELGCAVLTRDTSACEEDRTEQGLSGFWLKFSCRVTLTKDGDDVTIETDSRPDYKTQYFGESHVCYEEFSASGRNTNPNEIEAQSISMTVPFSPTKAASMTETTGGTIGISVPGVSIFGNFAAPGDNIYDEIATFDKCEGHPQNSGNYHYHSEPTSITQNDSAFVGVMRDGFPVYGRKDKDGTTPSDLDDAGGHTGETPDSDGEEVYHYHVNYQTDGTDSAYFISTGYFAGTPGDCTSCQ